MILFTKTFKIEEHTNSKNLIGYKKWNFIDVSARLGDWGNFNNNEDNLYLFGTYSFQNVLSIILFNPYSNFRKRVMI